MTAETALPTVAVFGGSDPAPDTDAYRIAREVGRRLAEAGFSLINGGYGGVMEASARGARDAGGHTIGVTVAAFARTTGANQFIVRELVTDDLYDRTRRLIEDAVAFIVLRGRVGTLAELAFLWALSKSGTLGVKPIILLDPVWEELLTRLQRLGIVGAAELASTRVARDPRQAVDILRRECPGIR